ncbi:MAG: adenylate cyclase [Novosphingobium sp.]
MATLADGATRDKPFFLRMISGIALVIVLGFAQFAARGFVNFGAVPLWVHFHGLVMLSWLGLLVYQSSLVQRGNLVLHRQLGLLGVALAAALVVLGMFTGVRAIALHRVPPYFSDAYFLALTQVGLLIFAGMIVAAVANRNRPERHRRLMVGALVLLMEPAFGRLLPMPLMGIWGEWVVMMIQLATLGLVARHDRKRFVGIHPATVVSAVVVVFAHVAVTLAALTPFFIERAAAIAAH